MKRGFIVFDGERELYRTRASVDQDGGLLDGQFALEVPPGAMDDKGEVDLEAAKSFAVEKLNAQAEAIRAASMPAPGLARAYARKEAEARAILAGRKAGPMLTEEASQTGRTLQDLATAVVANADADVAADAKLEAVRRGGVGAIETAESLHDLAKASKVDWPDAG